MAILTRLIFASLLADFVLQPSFLVEWKYRSLRGLLVHVSVVFLVTLGMGVGSWSSSYRVLAAAIAITHFAIDWAKIVIDRSRSHGYWPLTTFLADQILHFATILGWTAVFGALSGQEIARWFTAWVFDPKLLAVASTYVAALFGGSALVRVVIQTFAPLDREPQGPRSHHQPRAPEPRPGLAGAGAFIGVVERLILTSLVATNQFGAAGFVLAAKSVARYKRMEEDPAFAEYYLVGTLTSSAIAVAAGLLVRHLLS